MDSKELWPKVRSAPLTREELRLIYERAQDCASDEEIRQDHSTWQLRAGVWRALAQAAYACDALIARDEQVRMWGMPPTAHPSNGDARGEKSNG